MPWWGRVLARRNLADEPVNPFVRALLQWRVPVTRAALLETTGRARGQLRRLFCLSATVGVTFWIISAHGRRSEHREGPSCPR